MWLYLLVIGHNNVSLPSVTNTTYYEEKVKDKIMSDYLN